MTEPRPDDGLLTPYRVLDLTDEKGLLCGKILGDLGADVIKVEKPGGDPARCIGPFYHDEPHPEKSLYWAAYNSNKRGITLDLETKDGQAIFRELAKRADFVVESYAPGYLDRLGLGYAALSTINPRIIVTSITPFGQTGPYAGYKATDMVVTATSGFMYLLGDPDRPPVHISFPQAYLNAALEAVVGTVVAHYHRERTGEGQYVDVSAQAAISWCTAGAHQFWELNRAALRRTGPFRVFWSALGVKHRVHWACKDGYVAFPLFGGQTGARTNQALVSWMDSEGLATEHLKSIDWPKFDLAMMTEQEWDLFAEPVARFFRAHTVAEVNAGALERGMMLAPVRSMREVREDAQLAARGFWEEVEHPELNDTVTYPGAFVKSSAVEMKIRRRAPRIGEHNEEVYLKELGLSRERLLLLRQARVI